MGFGSWRFKSPLPHHNFLVILPVTKKGGDDRRPPGTIRTVNVPRFEKTQVAFVESTAGSRNNSL